MCEQNTHTVEACMVNVVYPLNNSDILPLLLLADNAMLYAFDFCEHVKNADELAKKHCCTYSITEPLTWLKSPTVALSTLLSRQKLQDQM